MDCGDTEALWAEWVCGVACLSDGVVRRVCVEVLVFLDGLPTDRMVPLMTRCRALPEVIAAIRECRSPGWDQAVLTGAPQDVRKAFNEIRLLATRHK